MYLQKHSKPSEENNTNNQDHKRELDFPFKCDEYDYRSSTIKGLHIHTKKKTYNRGPVGWCEDNDFKKDIGVETEDSLLIFLQG